MAPTTFDSWLSSLGFFTKATLGLTVGLAALSTFGMLSPAYLVLNAETWRSLQLWRPITASVFFGNFSFQWMMSVGMLVTYMNYNEMYDFKNTPGNFVWFLFWIILLESIAGIALGFYVTSFSLCTSLCWTFCRRNANQPVSLFGFTFSAGMFPWALSGLHVLMGQSVIPDLVGIVVGHAVLFLFDVLPAAHPVWRRLASTPAPLRRFVDSRVRGNSGGADSTVSGRPPMHREVHPDTSAWSSSSAARPQASTTYRWGSGGRKLGDS